MHYLLSLSLILGASGFSFFDQQTSFVQFKRLRAQTDGRIDVSFRCKTYREAGLLLYADDANDNGEYITLYLRKGFVVFELLDGNGKLFEASSKATINDLQWHEIVVTLSSDQAVFRLNNATQDVFNITKMQLKSDFYVGGFPNNIDIFRLSHDEMVFVQRFLGCIEDVEISRTAGNVTQRNATMLRSAGVSLECKDACKSTNPCRNNGVCVNKFAMAECSCDGTGYHGKTCEKESAVIGISSAEHGVIFDVETSYVSSAVTTTSLFMRVRSSQADGVFFYTVNGGDYILLQLSNGRIAASVDLGSGSVTIATKKNTYADNQWHRVKLKRVKRLVNLTVDDSEILGGKTRGSFDKFQLPDKKMNFVIGGLADSQKWRLKNLSGKNFTGCLQELTFNGYNLIEKYNKSAKEIVARGKFSKTCPKMPQKIVSTQPSTTAFPTFKATKATGVFSTTSSRMTGQTSPCILAGISCPSATANIPTSQAHAVTSSQAQTTVEARSGISSQSATSSKGSILSTVKGNLKTNSSTSESNQNLSTDKDVLATTSKPFSTKKEVAQTDSARHSTDKVVMASQSELREGDLTLYFILAAVVGLVAFLLAILIIVKVSSASKKKYAIKRNKSERDYWADTGSFHRSTKESKPLV